MNIEREFNTTGAALVESPGANVFHGDGYGGRICLRFGSADGAALRAYLSPDEALRLASLLLQAGLYYRP